MPHGGAWQILCDCSVCLASLRHSPTFEFSNTPGVQPSPLFCRIGRYLWWPSITVRGRLSKLPPWTGRKTS